MAICEKRHGALVYLTADGIPAPHCFTTRKGGVSTGYLSSLNIGSSRGDDPANVRKNFAILGDAIVFSPECLVLTKQTHSDIVLQVGKAHWGTGLTRPPFEECDALITNEPGTALTVFTADCTPVLLHDPVTGAVGAVHAGWRGTANAIVRKTVEAMVCAYGCDPENIRAAIGPNISQCCFETDWDVPEAMLKAVGHRAWDCIRKAGNKYYVNLKAINALHLSDAGVRKIEISSDCTVCRSDLYWSHRVTGGNRGAQGAIIVCKGVDV